MRLTRNMTPKILKLLDYFPVVALLGVRQCGKTTLARQLRPDWRYVDLESATDFDLVAADPGLFLRQNSSGVVFDEAQLCPQLFSELRHAIDQERGQKGRFLITGSSSPQLLQQITQTLAGRIATVKIEPLKLNEIYSAPFSALYSIIAEPKTLDNLNTLVPVCSEADLLNTWFAGGYPEPRVVNEVAFSMLWSDQYVKSYLERDIARLFPGLNSTRYRRFLTLLANISGAVVNQSNTARVLEVSAPTVKDYFDIAAGTFFWRAITSFERNVQKAVVKMPRGHICDSGVLHTLLKIGSLEMLQGHPCMGFSFESFVIEEILRGLESTMLTAWSAHFYRTKAQSEIDLIIDSPNGCIPIEVKYGSTLRRASLSTITKFIKENKCPLGFVINNSERVEQLGENLYQVPVRYI
jgi:uncharacterized protein